MIKAWRIARRLAEYGVKVIPIPAKEKGCKLANWPELATTDLEQISKWIEEDPDSNYGAVCTPDTIVVLDADNPGLRSHIERATGREFPSTLTVKSSKGYHYYFLQTDKSRAIGNRKLAGMFDLQSDRKYVVGPGSIHPSGAEYTILNDTDIVPMPDWLAERLDTASKPAKARGKRDYPETREDFDADDLFNWYAEQDAFVIEGYRAWNGNQIHITDKCIISGHKHRGSWHTGFIVGDGFIGYHCESPECENPSVGDVLRKLNELGYAPYPKRIWEEQEADTSKFPVDDLTNEPDDDDAEYEGGLKQGDVLALSGLINWDALADKLDEIRRRKKLKEYQDKNGEWHSKEVDEEAHVGDEKILQFITAVVKKHGKMYCDAYPYIFINEEHRLYNWMNPDDVFELLGRLRLRLVQRDSKLVQDNMALEILLRGEHTRIAKYGCMKDGVLYVNNGRGGMFKLTPEDITEVDNGTDGVLVLDPEVKPWPTVAGNEERIQAIARQIGYIGGKVVPTSALCRHFTGMFEEDNLTTSQYQQLLLLRYLSLFMGNTISLLPILMSLGEQGSGKSTLWEKFFWLIQGPEYESGALPTKMRDFVAAITNSQAQIFDNVDGANFSNPKADYAGYIDLMCKCSTGGKIKIAELYKTNTSKEYNLRCDLFLTARVNPFPSNRSDLSRRMLYFPVRKPEQGEYVTVEEMKEQLQADAGEMKLETLVRLHYIVKALAANQKRYLPVSEMHSYENWTMRIADYEGWASEMTAIWRGCMKSYREKVTEDSPLVNVIRCWLGSSPKNIGRTVRASEMYKELSERYGREFRAIWKTDAVFGRRIKENISSLRLLGVEDGKRDGCSSYCFYPDEGQKGQCINAYKDSTPEWKLRSDADDEKLDALAYSD